jgi:Ni/Co efflux regulator RcnB
MKRTKIACALAVASLSVGVAFAQEPPNDGRNAAAARMREQTQRIDQSRNNRQNDRRDVRNDARHDDRHDGAGPNHSFYRGGRLPDNYRGRQYVVDDWRGHHLSAPPRGYHWVQTGSDYVLAAVATGLIASVILNSH